MELGKQIRFARLNQYANRADIDRKCKWESGRLRDIEECRIIPTPGDIKAICAMLEIPEWVLAQVHTCKDIIKPYISFMKACVQLDNPTYDDIDNLMEAYVTYWCTHRVSHNANFAKFLGFTVEEYWAYYNGKKTLHDIVDSHIGHKSFTLPSIPDGFAEMLVREHGAAQQDMVLIEECSELQKELCKSQRKRNKHLPDNKAAIIEEMSHVLISMQVNMHARGITQSELEDAFNAKIAEYNGKNHNGNI